MCRENRKGGQLGEVLRPIMWAKRKRWGSENTSLHRFSKILEIRISGVREQHMRAGKCSKQNSSRNLAFMFSKMRVFVEVTNILLEKQLTRLFITSTPEQLKRLVLQYASL